MLSVLLVTLLTVASICVAPHAVAQLRTWHMLPQPEQFTELYFTNPNTLPHTYTPGQSQAVSFGITSHAFEVKAYTYSIFADTPAGVISLASGSISVPPHTPQRISKTFAVADAGDRIRITIVLQNGNEQQVISYWITRKGA